MTLIKSISGIRGTIGGNAGDAFTPIDIVKFSSAFGWWIKNQATGNQRVRVVIGRDARISGEVVAGLVSASLQSLGIDVIDLGHSTTPTVEMAVVNEQADGGIILTASHNPIQWNALKLLNARGEFISARDGEEVLEIADKEEFVFSEVLDLGKQESRSEYIDWHIEQILKLPLVNTEAIRNAGFRVVIDAVNSTGGIAVPKLLKALGVNEVVELYCTPTGHFPHNPEPLPEHLTDIIATVKKEKADVGFIVDPDVDRLAMVSENGEVFGEEYTLVAVADYVLQHTPGNTVSNLSSTRALRDVTEKHGKTHFMSAVGEVNVVEKMKAEKAVIGGEGNGGIIYPELHYGRDALVGIALFLSHLATHGGKCSELRNDYTNYFISKNKIELTPQIDVDALLVEMEKKYDTQPHTTIDGLKIEFGNSWVHLRKSNTEPIIRVYAESEAKKDADDLAQRIMNEINQLTMSKTV
jgi:phosphomannomutase